MRKRSGLSGQELRAHCTAFERSFGFSLFSLTGSNLGSRFGLDES